MVAIEPKPVSRICAALMIVALPGVLKAENLIRYGTFENDKAEIMREIRDGNRIDEYKGSFDLFTEDETWNKCLRLTASPARKHKVSGNNISGAGASALK